MFFLASEVVRGAVVGIMYKLPRSGLNLPDKGPDMSERIEQLLKLKDDNQQKPTLCSEQE